MKPEALLALSIFAFVTSVTPGPNNMMLLASGVNFGIRRTIPHMLGIAAGFTAMLLLVGLGLGAIVTAVPAVLVVLKVASAAYMLWLAWRLATSGSFGTGAGPARR
jgi:threonine/homoserine/homoserine lactone efflux protein